MYPNGHIKKVQHADVQLALKRYRVSDETLKNVEQEKLLPPGLIQRLHNNYPKYSGLFLDEEIIFDEKPHYSGLKGFREIVQKLKSHGIEIDHLKDREFFVEVYRFLATSFVLNTIDWKHYQNDSNYQLIFPQPGMMPANEVKKYAEAKSDEERKKVVEDYILKTNPHDGKQKLNKPWFINDEGHLEILEGSQHKYPPIKLILDKTTQTCFSFCTYCFRHAQVRGDEDMFVQQEVAQVHEYLKRHKEVSDILITGGDGGYIPYERLLEYVTPIIKDPDLMHIRTVRIGSRAINFQPELILSDKFKANLELLQKLRENGIQAVWVAHISTPHDILNPVSVAAIRRLKKYGITIKSQSPIMNHISLFYDENGKVDIDRSAQNWIDLGNVLGMLGIGFHSMYCARPTGEHHYFTAPLADISKIFNKVYRSLSSVNRPSRYITMTSSAGKTSLLGTAEINGEKVFVLKFNEARNMEWMDTTFFAKYDEAENTIEKLIPFDSVKYFYEDELAEIENKLSDALAKEIKLAEKHD